MQKANKFIFLVLIILLSTSSGEVFSQISGKETITAQELKAHLNVIASDEFEGRETTKRGMKLAARYIASYLDAYGYKPLGDEGTFYQNFKVNVTSLPAELDLIVKSGYSKKVFKNGKDFIIAQAPGKSQKFSGGLVFAGYGISAPELGWDDYTALDAKGKFVMLLMDNPKDKGELSEISQNQKFDTAYEKGAAGVIIIIPRQMEAQWEGIAQSFFGREEMSLAGSRREGDNLILGIPLKAAGEMLGLTEEKFETMKSAVENLEKVAPMEVEGTTVSIDFELKKETRTTQNVVGVLEGSDPVLKNEYVTLGAHYDHEGMKGGVVFNGANDNASGTVALLEIAQAFTMEKRPKRSILFIFHTGEEKGLLGAQYFVDNSPVPIEKISCNLNLDMVARNEPNSIYIVGSDRHSTELHKINEAANKKEVGLNLDYKYNAPDNPDQIYFRSDHIIYARLGIPVIFYYSGPHPDLHQPGDTPDKCDYEKAEKVTRLVYCTAREVANLDHLLILDKDVKYRGKPKLSDETGRESITKGELLAHLSFIASDELEGREATKRGIQIAARYIASHLKSYGFEPLDKEKTYFQKFNIAVEKLSSDSKLTLRKNGDEKTFTAKEDFVVVENFPGRVQAAGGLVFAGYGIHYPELDWDDFSGLDIDGKFVVIAQGRPTHRDTIFARREHSRKIFGKRMKYLRDNNAAGFIYIANQRFLKSWNRFAERESFKMPDTVDKFPRYIVTMDMKPEAAAEALGLSEYQLKEIMDSAGKGEKLRTFESVDAMAYVSLIKERELKEAKNVIGVLEGSDPVLKNEYVSFGCHYDHVGIINGEIYNGANDDGTGVAGLLEIAEAFVKGDRPKRSILMVFHTAEEKGLYGSKYFTDNSLVPLEKIDCNLNIDMIGRRGTDSLFIIGADRLSTELDRINRQINEEKTKMIFDYKYNDPKDPSRSYYRSDHYPYARYGIPAIFYFSGSTEDTHEPTDDVEKIDFEKFEKMTRHIYSVGFKIANLDHMLEVEKGPKKRGKTKK